MDSAEGKPAEIDYAGETDVLFAGVTPIPPTVSDPAAVDFFLLRDKGSDKVLGFECLDFSRHVQDEGCWLASLPVEPVLFDPNRRAYTPREFLALAWREVRKHASGPVREPVLNLA